MDKTSERPSLFVVSTGRTGTQFVAEVFDGMGADSSHEPGPRWLRLLSNAHVSGTLGGPSTQKLLSRAREETVRADGPLYVEASCLVYGLVQPILELFEQARVIHIVRDPKTYVRSAVNWGVHRLGGRPLNLLPFRRLSPPQTRPLDLLQRLSWARKGQFERVCWTWTHMNRSIREQGAGHSRFQTVKFEEVFDATEGFPGLRRVLATGGFDPPPELVSKLGKHRQNPARRSGFPPWLDWSPSQRAVLRDYCESEAAHYGYDLASE